MSNYAVKTPHAAVLIWNYKDRVDIPDGDYNKSGVNPKLSGVEGAAPDKNGETVPVIVSTLSCVSIQTQKSKSSPVGTFNLVLAPFKNWTANLTAGSWCCLLMSNLPILEKDLKHADKDKVKMFGRIESVRTETKIDDTGARQTLYYVSGTDWGEVFNSTIYIDNLIKGPNDKGNNQGDVFAIAMRKILFSNGGSPKAFTVDYNLRSILSIMGEDVTEQADPNRLVARLAGAMYKFSLPKEVVRYFDFRELGAGASVSKNKIPTGDSVNSFIKLVTGTLTGNDKYEPSNEALGFIDPFSLQGTHSLWQILLENSNPALNEMVTDFRWSSEKGDNGVVLGLYNRIKPFTYKNFKANAGEKHSLRSYFQNVKMNDIKDIDIVSINAGTNWRDKINFIEIKPNFSEFEVVSNWITQKSQVFDPLSFQREGFRSMIVGTKQFPAKKGTPTSPKASSAKSTTTDVAAKDFGGADWNALETWAKIMREWYFGTHRMLNGTLTMQGTTSYIAVGDNIRFNANLLNPTPNMNSEAVKNKTNEYILAHVESVSHSFTVDNNGARSYRTTIQFVRGITVDVNNQPYGEGMLDVDATKTTQSDDRNRNNVVSTSDIVSDPDPQKVKGT